MQITASCGNRFKVIHKASAEKYFLMLKSSCNSKFSDCIILDSQHYLLAEAFLVYVSIDLNFFEMSPFL